jgi:predicted acylesterase/phospholipase RssA
MPDNSNKTEDQKIVKLSIEDLKYLVMEGGGARGNTFVGAVRELEDQLLCRVQKVNENNSPLGKEKITSIENTGSKKRYPAIMDYLKQDPNNSENYIPIIEGVAGASAGAITTFALVLGLNSDEIKTILKFDFSRFLSEIDAGKYRMIDENSELKIGEDTTIYNEQDSLFETNQKKLGGKSTNFDYKLDKNKTNIIGNPIKLAKRSLFVNFIVKVAADGAVYNLNQLYSLLSNKSKPNWIVKLMQKIFGSNLSNSKEAGASALTRTILYSSGLLSLYYFFYRKKKMGMQINSNSIMGVFADRGMYSGFQVRDFFFDIMIFAATRDTFFQKQLIKNYKKDYPNLSRESFIVTNKYQNAKNKEEDFVIGARGDYSYTQEFEMLIEKKLKKISFTDLFELLGVEFAAAVSNFTTNSPLYFSHKYTPNFPVLEAVGASMSIPPAIRPLYNASDVFNYVDDDLKQNPQNSFLKNSQFKRSDYELNEYATKVALKDYLKESVFIDLNNVIELNTFLNVIQRILIEEKKSNDKNSEEKWTDKKVVVNNKEIIITKRVLAYFYNAQYKGLLIDGGYFNNIPFNYFRDKGDKSTIDNVFAIKLDRSFPPDFMDEVNTIMEKLKSKEKKIIDKITREETEITKFIPENYAVDDEFIKEFEQAVKEIQKLLDAHILSEKKSSLKKQLEEGDLTEEQKKRLEALIKNFRANRKNILKIIEEWYLQYGKQNDIKPWEIPRPIIDIAFSGYAYGSKRGQIRDITDHKYIVSLYDYGVGTYDFDLDKVRLLAEFAQGEAQYKVNLFFS